MTEPVQSTASVPQEAQDTSDAVKQTPTLSAAEKAFDLFDGGKISETALLVAVGAGRIGFELAEDLRLRTLHAFEDGRLSEDAMVKLLS